MHNNRGLRPVTEGGLLIAISVMFSLIGAYLPVLSVVTDLLWPVPIVLLCVRHGFRHSLSATMISAILLAVLLHPLQGILTVVSLGLMANVLGVAFRRHWAPARTLLWTGMASLVSLVVMIAVGLWLSGIDPLTEQQNMFGQIGQQIGEMYEQMGLPAGATDQFTRQIEIFQQLVAVVFPALLIMAATFSAWLNFTVTRGILNRLGGNYRGLPPFRHWQAPRHVVWGLAVAMVMLIFAEKNELQMTKNIGLNLQILTSSVLFVCGLSLLAFWLSRYRLARFLRVIILVFVAVNGFLSQLAILAAIADVVFDFRKLRNRNQLGG